MKHFKKLILCLNAMVVFNFFAAEKQQPKIERKEREEKHTEAEQAKRLRKALRTLPTELYEKISEYVPRDGVKATLEGHTGPVLFLQWKSEEELVSSDFGSVSGDSIRTWNVTTGDMVSSIVQPSEKDAAWILVKCPFDEYRIFNRKDYQSSHVWFHIKPIAEFYSQDGAGKDAEGCVAVTVSVYHRNIYVERNDESYRIPLPRQDREFLSEIRNSNTSMALNPDAIVLATGSRDNVVKLWNTETGKLVKILRGHQAPVYSVTWSPSGSLLASGDANGVIKIWQISGARGAMRTARQREIAHHDQLVTPIISERLRKVPFLQQMKNLELQRLSTKYPELYKQAYALYAKENPIVRILDNINQKLLREQLRKLVRAGDTEQTNKELKALANKNRALFEKIQKEERGRKIIADALLCTICQESFEPGKQAVITECGHPFHSECMEGLLKNLPTKDETHIATQNCPVCRSVIRELGALNPITKRREHPSPAKIREIIVGAQAAEQPLELTAEEQQAARTTLLQLINTEKRSAEEESMFQKLKEHFPALYAQAYTDYGIVLQIVERLHQVPLSKQTRDKELMNLREQYPELYQRAYELFEEQEHVAMVEE